MFAGLKITNRGALVLGVILVVALVALSILVNGMLPAMGPDTITDEMWQQGVDAARSR